MSTSTMKSNSIIKALNADFNGDCVEIPVEYLEENFSTRAMLDKQPVNMNASRPYSTQIIDSSVITRNSMRKIRNLLRHGSRRTKVLVRRNLDLMPWDVLTRVKYPHLQPEDSEILLKLIDTNSFTVQDRYLETYFEEHGNPPALVEIYQTNDLDHRWMLAHQHLGTPEHLKKAKVLKHWLGLKRGGHWADTDLELL